MEHKTPLPFDLEILPQPNDETCGATCLHAIYKHYGDFIGLDQLIKEIFTLETGGTLAVVLGTHALERGYKATIYTYNLHVFDPSWFTNEKVNLRKKIMQQVDCKKDDKLSWASEAYIRFLDAGGSLKFEELDDFLLRKYLDNGKPVLTGLNATYLYNWPREADNEFDDVCGYTMGHFVVLYGFDKGDQKVLVADPLINNPFLNQKYRVNIGRVINSILLGILTYDANFLVIEKP